MSKMKRCREGKNCGATCINRGKNCLIGLNEPLGKDLSSLSSNILGGSRRDSTPVSSQQSIGELLDAGVGFMQSYSNRLKVILSQEKRSKRVADSLMDRLLDMENIIPDGGTRDKMVGMVRKLRDKEFEAQDKRDGIMSEIRGNLLKTNLTNEQVTSIVSSVNVDIKDSDIRGKVRGQVEEFVRMFNGRGVADFLDRGSVTPSAKLIEFSSFRPYAIEAKGVIGTGGDHKSTFHELGHFVEYQSRVLQIHAEKWRNMKAFTSDQIRSLDKSNPSYSLVFKDNQIIQSAGEMPPPRKLPVFRLQDMEPYAGFRRDEVALVGRYMHFYMGRIGRPGTSEVISMALENFSSPKDMGILHVNHPELFNLAVGLAITPSN